MLMLPFLTTIALLQPPVVRDHSATIVLEIDDKLGGCAIGDVDPAHEGAEIVVVSAGGAVFVARRSGDSWSHERALQTPGELIQVAAGDAMPERPGDEIVAVGIAEGGESSGGAGVVFVIWREDGEWRSTRAFESKALVHGVAIGDGVVYATGFDRRVHALRGGADGFTHLASAELPGDGKNALAVPGGVLVACTDGSVIEAKLRGDAMISEVIDRRDAPRARLGGDRDNLVVCDDDGVLSLVTKSGRRELFRDSKKLRGAVFADLDPAVPGPEAATTGYSGQVVILRAGESGWSPSLLFADRAAFHHACAGDVDGRPGNELVVCGMAGRVMMFRFANNELAVPTDAKGERDER